VRDLSKEALFEKKCPKILEKIDAPLRPAELLPYMRAEDGWTEEMIAAMVKDLQTS